MIEKLGSVHIVVEMKRFGSRDDIAKEKVIVLKVGLVIDRVFKTVNVLGQVLVNIEVDELVVLSVSE